MSRENSAGGGVGRGGSPAPGAAVGAGLAGAADAGAAGAGFAARLARGARGAAVPAGRRLRLVGAWSEDPASLEEAGSSVSGEVP